MIVMVTIVIVMTTNNRNATVSVLVKLLPYLISSLGLHAVFIFHGLAHQSLYLLSGIKFSITLILAFTLHLHPGPCAPLEHFLFGFSFLRQVEKPSPSSLPSTRRIRI